MRGLLFGLFLISLSGAAFAQTAPAEHRLDDDLTVRQLSEGVYLHTSWRDFAGGVRFPSHGLIVVSEGEALLVDTAWGDTLTNILLQWIDAALDVSVEGAVLTHAHDDRMGGIATLKRAGVTTYALPQTAEGARRQHWPRPDSLLALSQTISVGSRTVETFFPGPGHTRDNLVVWLAREKLLFGGCMIRPAMSKGLGNVAEADIEAWPASVSRVRSRYEAVEVVVPSHGPVGDRGLLDHTLRLLEARDTKPPD